MYVYRYVVSEKVILSSWFSDIFFFWSAAFFVPSLLPTSKSKTKPTVTVLDVSSVRLKKLNYKQSYVS